MKQARPAGLFTGIIPSQLKPKPTETNDKKPSVKRSIGMFTAKPPETVHPPYLPSFGKKNVTIDTPCPNDDEKHPEQKKPEEKRPEPLPIISTVSEPIYKRNTPPKTIAKPTIYPATKTETKNTVAVIQQSTASTFYVPSFAPKDPEPIDSILDYMMKSPLDLHGDRTKVIYEHIMQPQTLTIIQGPPGSGKSYCIKQAVQALHAQYHPCTTLEEILSVQQLLTGGLLDMSVKHVVHIDLGDFTFQLTNSSPKKSHRAQLKSLINRFFSKYVDPNPKRKRTFKRKMVKQVDSDEDNASKKIRKTNNKNPIVIHLKPEDLVDDDKDKKQEKGQPKTRKQATKTPEDRLISQQAKANRLVATLEKLPVSAVITCYNKYESNLWEAIREVPHATIYLQTLRKSDRGLFFREAAKFFPTPPVGLANCINDSQTDLTSCLVQLEAGFYASDLYMCAFQDTSLPLKNALNRIMCPPQQGPNDTDGYISVQISDYYDLWAEQVDLPDKLMTQTWKHYPTAFPNVPFDPNYKRSWNTGDEYVPVSESLSWWTSTQEQDQPFVPPHFMTEDSIRTPVAYQFFMTLFICLRQVPRTWNLDAFHELTGSLPYISNTFKACKLTWADVQDIMINVGPVFDRIGQYTTLVSAESDPNQVYQTRNMFEDDDVIANTIRKKKNKDIGIRLQDRKAASKMIAHLMTLASESSTEDTSRVLPDADTD